MENEKAEVIKLNHFVTVCNPEVEDIKRFEYDLKEAQLMYTEKRKLIDDVFLHIGAEHYGEISTVLYGKCFGHVDMEEISQHIMYRVLMGTTIDSSDDGEKFIYDKHDKTLEVFLTHIVYADSLEKALNIIDAIKPDLDINKDVAEEETVN